MSKAKPNPFRSLLEQRDAEPETSQALAPVMPIKPAAPVSQPEPQPGVSDEPQDLPKRRGRAKGKRSDPNYTQVGAYIPKTLDKAVKRKLLDEEMDFSELIAHLLETWVND